MTKCVINVGPCPWRNHVKVTVLFQVLQLGIEDRLRTIQDRSEAFDRSLLYRKYDIGVVMNFSSAKMLKFSSVLALKVVFSLPCARVDLQLIMIS